MVDRLNSDALFDLERLKSDEFAAGVKIKKRNGLITPVYVRYTSARRGMTILDSSVCLTDQTGQD